MIFHLARVITAWKQANVMTEIKLQTESVTGAHGEPVTKSPCDWTSLMAEFKGRCGKQLLDEKLPVQSFSSILPKYLPKGH